MNSRFIPIEPICTHLHKPDVEYVDGELEERNVGEFDHNMIQRAVLFWFYLHEKEWGIRAIQKPRTRTRPQLIARSPVPGRSALSGCRKDQELHEVWRANYLDCGLKD